MNLSMHKAVASAAMVVLVGLVILLAPPVYASDDKCNGGNATCPQTQSAPSAPPPSSSAPQTCPDGSPIPTSGICSQSITPPIIQVPQEQTQTCSDGSIIPISQTCATQPSSSSSSGSHSSGHSNKHTSGSSSVTKATNQDIIACVNSTVKNSFSDAAISGSLTVSFSTIPLAVSWIV